MAKQIKETIQRASEEVRGNFNLSRFKEKKGFGAQNAKYKEQSWIPLSKAWQDVINLPGIPQGQITVLRGHSDTGKTTTMLECAASCQKRGILPVFIITEVKFSWQYARDLGVEFEEVVDKETGEIIGYDGFFIYVDRSSLNTIEDVAGFISSLLDDQAKGNLPYDLCFLWDSIGSVPCEQSVQSNKNNNQWNAGALSTQFGGFINQKIVLSRKHSSPYTNTLVVINKIWVSPPETFMASPKISNKGGETMFYDSALVITYGNIANSGVTKLKAIANRKEFEWGKRTSISVDKCHLSNITSKGKIIMTPTGFIAADDKEVEKYKKEHIGEWSQQLGSTDISYIEEEVPVDESSLL